MPAWLLILESAMSAISVLAPIVEQIINDVKANGGTPTAAQSAQINALMSAPMALMDMMKTASTPKE